MKVSAALLLSMCISIAVFASECDCTTFPFKPSPPCYGRCVEKLSTKTSDLSAVKHIDPVVSRNIKALASRADRSEIDFSKIRGKSDLEVVLKSPEITKDKRMGKKDFLSKIRGKNDREEVVKPYENKDKKLDKKNFPELRTSKQNE